MTDRRGSGGDGSATAGTNVQGRLSDNLTVDQIAGLTDADMVRRRFDRENIRWASVLGALTLVVATFQVMVALGKSLGANLLPLALANFVLAICAAAFFGELAFSERRRDGKPPRLPVHLLSRNFTPWLLSYIVVEFLFLMIIHKRGSDAWLAWAMIVPWFVIPVRLETSRRAALHLSLLGLVLVGALFFGTSGKTPTPEYVSSVTFSLLAFLFGSGLSRRLRRQTIEEWSERRVHAREQLRMRNELQYAREVQLSMLPATAPSVEWLDLAGTSVPASEVGGDYYDYFVDDGAVSIVCGDVAGHGLASGIVLAALRSGFTLLRDSLDDPAAVLQRLSDLVAQTSRRRMLATAAVVRIDRVTRLATIASAGHPPVIIRRASASETIELFAPPLGVRLPYRVPSTQIAFERGDVFVLHSDGVYESQNPAGESYGLDRVSMLLETLWDTDAATVRDALIADVEQFRAGIPQHDDVTIVVARVR
jgi:hypothetical protein